MAHARPILPVGPDNAPANGAGGVVVCAPSPAGLGAGGRARAVSDGQRRGMRGPGKGSHGRRLKTHPRIPHIVAGKLTQGILPHGIGALRRMAMPRRASRFGESVDSRSFRISAVSFPGSAEVARMTHLPALGAPYL